jgi:hypothetical protein
VGEVVDLVIDSRRGERISLELPLSLRVAPDAAREELGLPDWVDLSDPIVTRAILLLRAARRASPPVALALLGGAAHRLRCPSSNRADLGLRRPLHDLDLACLHKELRTVRSFLASVHERDGSALRLFETSGDRIFNSLSEGRRLRLHLVLGQDGPDVALGTVDLLADEFRFCHRLDLRADVAAAAHGPGTLSPALLLLAKMQFLREVPVEDRDRVADRVLEPFGRRSVLIGPEPKDVKDVLALLIDHPLDDGPDGISPRRLGEILGGDWGLHRTFSLNLGMISRSAELHAVPERPRAAATAQLDALAQLAAGLSPKRRLGFLGGRWWEEVDSPPAVDGRATAA